MKKTLFSLILISVGAIGLSGCTGTAFAPAGGAPMAPAGSTQANQATLESQQMKQSGVTEASSLSSPPSEGAVGGNVGGRMDSMDRGRLFKALDNPIGRPTTWTNRVTRVTYTVTPTQKTVINENPFCRKYRVSAESGGSVQDFDGTACISSDGNWHSVR